MHQHPDNAMLELMIMTANNSYNTNKYLPKQNYSSINKYMYNLILNFIST